MTASIRIQVRSLFLALLLGVLATPLLAQSPSVRLTEGPKNNQAEFMGRAAVDYPMLQVALQNQSTQALELRRIGFAASGTIDDVADINANGVRLVLDANGDGELTAGETVLGAGNFGSNNGGISFDLSGAPVAIAANATANVLVIVGLDQKASASLEETFQVSLPAVGDIDLRAQATQVQAQFQVNAFPVAGLVKRIGNGALSVTVEPDSANSKTIPYFLAGYQRTEGIRLKLSNSLDERVAIDTITVATAGSANDALIFATNGIQYVPLAARDSDLTQALQSLASATVSADNGTAVLTFTPPLTLLRGETRFAAIATNTTSQPAEYFKDAAFSIPEAGIAARGLDSLLAALPILGEGLTGPLRLYHGHDNQITKQGDLDAGPVTTGSINYPMLSLQIKNGKHEAVTLTALRIQHQGTLPIQEIVGVRIWRDANSDGEVDSAADELVSATATFSVPSPGAPPEAVITLNNIGLAANATLRAIVAVDLVPQATAGGTLQFAILEPRWLAGTGAATSAPTVTTNTPLLGTVRTVEPNVIILGELDGSKAFNERTQLPRRGEGIVLWNFGFNVSRAEPLVYTGLNVQLGGTVDDRDYLDVLELWYDKNNDGNHLTSSGEASPDTLLSRIVLDTDNQLIAFRDDEVTEPLILKKDTDHQFYILAKLKDASPAVYDLTQQCTIPAANSFLLQGKWSNRSVVLDNAPFESLEKPIVRPTATLLPGPWPSGGGTIQTCINNSAAPMIMFRLTNGDSERLNWRGIQLTGNSSDGAAGLESHVDSVWVYVDKNSDATYNGSDAPLAYPSLHVFRFNGLAAFLDLATSLADILPFYSNTDRDLIQLRRQITSTFLLAYDLGSPAPVAVDGSVTFSGRIAAGGLQLVGADSGDEVIISGDTDMTGLIAMSKGAVTLSNTSLGLDRYNEVVIPSCPVPPASCSDWVPALSVGVSTTVLEWLQLGQLVVNVDVTSPVPLGQIVSEARITHREGLGYSLIAPLTVDTANNRLVFDPAAVTGQNEFYSFWTTPPNEFVVWVRILPTAQGQIQLRVASPDSIAFSGGCSLVPTGQIPETYPTQPPFLGRPLIFAVPTSDLELKIEKPEEDFPYVGFPGTAERFAAVRGRARTLNKDEGFLVERVMWQSTGTAHDVDALLETDFATGAPTPGSDREWTVSAGDPATLSFQLAASGAPAGVRYLRATTTFSGAATQVGVRYNPPGASADLTGATHLAFQARKSAAGNPQLRAVIVEADGDVWQTTTPFALTTSWQGFQQALTTPSLQPVSAAGGGVLNLGAITQIGFEILSNGSQGAPCHAEFDALASVFAGGATASITDLEAAALLSFDGQLVGSGRFDIDNGQLEFTGMSFVLPNSLKNLQLLLSPSVLTRTGANNGQTFSFVIPPGGIGGRGAISSGPLGMVNVYDDNVNSPPKETLPYQPPQVRIGADRIYVKVEQENAFPVFHVPDVDNVVTLAFHLRPGRPENLLLEEINIQTVGSLDDLVGLEGASVRLHENLAPTNKFEPGAAKDRQVGIGAFEVVDGVARVRFPGFLLEAAKNKSFILAVDLSAQALDFETFRHSLIGVEGVRARGVLSNDYATPWYGEDDTSKPSLGLLEGALNTVGKATLDFTETSRLANNDATKPVYVLPGTPNVPVLSFEGEALPIEDMLADSFTFKNKGGSDESLSVSQVRLYRDDSDDGIPDPGEPVLGSATFASDDETLTIPFAQPINVLREETARWLLTMDIDPSAQIGDIIQPYLELAPEQFTPDNTIVGGTGLFSDLPIGVIRSETKTQPFDGVYVNVTSGIVDLAKGTKNPVNRDVLINAGNVPLLQWTAKEVFELEAVSVTSVTFDVISDNSADLPVVLANAIFDLYREDVNCTNGVPDCNDTLLASAVYTPGVGVSAGTLLFDLSAENELVQPLQKVTYLVVARVLDAPQSAVLGRFFLRQSAPTQVLGVGQESLLPGVFRQPSGSFDSAKFTFNVSTTRVQRDSRSPATTSGIAPDGVNEILVAFTVKPSTGSNVRFDSVTIEHVGTAPAASTYVPNSVRLVYDIGSVAGRIDAGDRIVDSGDFSLSNRIVFDAFAPDLVIPANATHRFLVVANLSGATAAGLTVGARIPNDTGVLGFTAVPDLQPSALASTSLPITGGPTPLVNRTITVATPSGAVTETAAAPGALNRMLLHTQFSTSNAEDQTLKEVRGTMAGSAPIPGTLANAQVRLYYDKVANGIFDSGDTLVGTTTVQDDGTFAFTGLSYSMLRNRTQAFLLVVSVASNATLGTSLQATLTEVVSVGRYSLLNAAVIGLPYLGATFGIDVPRATFQLAASDTLPANVAAGTLAYPLLGFSVYASPAADLRLTRVLLEPATTDASTLPLAGTLRLVVDNNRTGRYETGSGGDTTLASGFDFAPGSKEITGLATLLPRGQATYFLLVADLPASGIGSTLAARVPSGGADVISDIDGAVILATGLGLDGTAKTVIDPALRRTGTQLEEFESATTWGFRPELEWSLVQDATRSRSGSGYVTANRPLDGRLVNGNYALFATTPVQMTTIAGSKKISAWARYNFPNSSWRGRLQTSVNGTTWANNVLFSGSSPQWVYAEGNLATASNTTETLWVRLLLEAPTTQNTADGFYFDVDRVMIRSTAPVLTVANFGMVGGASTTLRPGQRTVDVTFTNRQTTGAPLEVIQHSFHAQGADGRNWSAGLTAQYLTGSYNLPTGATNTFTYRLNLPAEVPPGALKLDVATRFKNPAVADGPENTYYMETASTGINLTVLPADDAFEPNNTYPVAPVIDLAPPTTTLTNLILANEDWYRIPMQQHRHFTIEANFAHAEGNLQLQVWDRRSSIGDDFGTAMAESYSTTDREYLTYVNLTDPEYLWLRVYSDSGYTSQIYNLTIRSYDFDDIYDTTGTGNDSPCFANVPTITLGTTYSELISREDDFYRITIPAGVQRINVRAEHSFFSGNLHMMVVRDQNCGLWFNEVLAGGYSDEAGNNFEEIVGINVAGLSTVLVRIFGANGDTNFYNLRAYETPAGQSAPAEIPAAFVAAAAPRPAPAAPAAPRAAGPDDVFDQNGGNQFFDTATPVAFTGQPIQLTGLVLNDEDWYRIEMGQHTHMRVTLTFSHAAGDINAQLWDRRSAFGIKWGTMVARSYTLDDAEVLNYVNLTQPEAIYLRVYGEGGATNPAYVIDIEPTYLDDVHDLDPLYNDGPCYLSANPVLNPGVYTDLISRDEDFYLVNTAGLQSIDVRVDHLFWSGNLHFMILDPAAPCQTWYTGVLAGAFSNVPQDYEELLNVPVGGRSQVLLRVYGAIRQTNYYDLTIVGR